MAASAAATTTARTAAAAAHPYHPHQPPHSLLIRRAAWTDSKGYTHFGERTALSPLGFGKGGGGGGRGSPHAKLMAGATAGIGLAFGLYWLSCRETVPFTGRKHSVLFVSPAMEAQMGRQTFDGIRRQAMAEGALLPDAHPAARLVSRVGQRVAQAVDRSAAEEEEEEAGGSTTSKSAPKAAWKHMRGLQWEYAVIDSPQVNAMVAPGAKVVVYTGLLHLINGNEDELAAVLAHEAAHCVARHHAERMGRANAAWFLNVLARWLLGVPIPGAVVALALVLPHSRANEREADAIGVRLAARACYDPAANVRMLSRLQMVEEGKGGGGGGSGSAAAALLRTHPMTGERVDAVRALLPSAMKEYHARCAAARAVLFPAEDLATVAAAAAPGPLG
jgi:metalloendopeptidase OMA1, mitochondrial